MKKNTNEYNDLVQILKEELEVAMGCTEPIAIAFAAAKCREVLGNIPDKVFVYCSGSIIKNVKSVKVPNTGGLHGIEVAAAAGILYGDSSKKLEVISKVTDEDLNNLNNYLAKNIIKSLYFENSCSLDVKVIEYFKNDVAIVRVSNNHTSVTHIEKNGEVLFHENVVDDADSGLTDRQFMTISNIYDFATTCDIDDVYDLINRQVEYNTAISKEGLDNEWGSSIGKVYINSYGDDVFVRASARAAAGSDARMNGCSMPVVILSGSGNQGITASVPIYEYAMEKGISKEKMFRAIVLSDLLTIHIKTGIGRLSAYCGAVVAGAGAGAGIAYLRGANLDGIGETIQNALAITSGIICDGAKSSCAAKIKTAVDAGIMGYEMFIANKNFEEEDGIVGDDVEKTIYNVGRLASEGMQDTNNTIIKIMLKGE